MIASRESEVAIIGCLLADYQMAWASCCEWDVNDNTFTDPMLKVIYGACSELLSNGKPSDLITVTNQLKRTGKYDSSGGASMLESIMDAVPTSVHVNHYCQVAKDYEVKRSVAESGMRMKDLAESSESSGDAILGEACSYMLSIKSSGSIKRSRSAIRKDILTSVERAKEKGCVGLTTPWRDITDLLGGIAPGIPVLIAGRRGDGKSTFSRNLIRHWGEQDIPIALALLEDTEDSFWMSQAGDLGDFCAFDAMRGRCDRKIEPYLDEAMQWPIEIVNDPSYTIERIIAWATRLKMTNDIQALVIDNYTQLETSANFKQESNEKDRHISNLISSTALRLNIPVIVLCHVTKENELKDRYLRLADVRGSGTIVDRARQVILIEPTESGKDARRRNPELDYFEYSVNVAKNNNGRTGIGLLYSQFNRQRFVKYRTNE